jgi:hypothetical protein
MDHGGRVNINAAFPSKYVKAAEIPEEGLTATIDRVEMEDVDGKGGMKPVLYFRKAKKGLVLNVTNSKKIQQLVGSADTDNWAGQAITLYQSETEYAGDTVACVRVRAAKNGAATPPPPAPSLGSPITDDDIPF